MKAITKPILGFIIEIRKINAKTKRILIYFFSVEYIERSN
jgi:hypothetical protein